MKTARNVAIVALIALAVWALPGGGSAAALFGALLFVVLTIGLGLFAANLYREHRIAIYGLGDRHRALLYGALGVAVFALAGSTRMLNTPIGAIVWIALVAGASFALYTVVRHARSY